MKAIIFYYSNSGKTKDVATKIQENLGCDNLSPVHHWRRSLLK